jgi:putative ABC transport system substrate-binding protein
MQRRQLLLAASAALAAPLRSFAQEKVHRIAWLSTSDRAGGQAFFGPFLEGMGELGYVQGRNLMVDARWGDYSGEKLAGLASDAIALKPSVIVTQGAALRSVHKSPGNIPVVFGVSGDPVELGVAKSLARPGGRFTGVTFLAYALSAKRVELLREIVPQARHMAIVSNPQHAGDAKELEATRAAAARSGLQVTHHPATDETGLQKALEGVAAAHADLLLVQPDGLFVRQSPALARFSVERRVPGISGWASLAESGTLVTYGPVLAESYRRLAYFVARILRGASPAELPIEQPTKIELVLNLKTAKALGLAIPQAILLRADRTIA